MKDLKIAIVHDYLHTYGGAEKVLEALIELFPSADIYTSTYIKTKMPATINNQKVNASKLPLINDYTKLYTPIMPLVFENMDLRKYDLVISDTTAWAKGVLTKPEQLHISYIHTPPRFLYGYSRESKPNNFVKPITVLIEHFIRMWDFSASKRPDYLIANSLETQRRIEHFYNRQAEVIYPPVENNTESDTSLVFNDFYLALGRLEKYKNFDELIEVFKKTNLNLVIAGSGSQYENLKELAGGNIFFVGKITEQQKTYLLQNCLGLINTVKDEDLGIVPIEAQMHGKPVLAHNSGGHRETIINQQTGILYESLDIQTIKDFDQKVKNSFFHSDNIKIHAERFSKENFKKHILAFVEDKINQNARTT